MACVMGCPHWRRTARLAPSRRFVFDSRGEPRAAYPVKQARPALLNLKHLSQMHESKPARVPDTPPPPAQPTISQVLHTLSSAQRRGDVVLVTRPKCLGDDWERGAKVVLGAR